MLSDDVRDALFARAEFAAKKEGDRVHFRCPRHKDRTPSAWMGGGAWGCFACGFQESITTLAQELGVPLAGNGNGSDMLREYIEATFDYVDEAGQLLYQVVRYHPKRFQQRKPDGRGGWIWSTKGVRRVLYRLPEVIAAVPTGQNIYVVEGEKHADRLRKDGLVATTNAAGAGKWQSEFSEFLRGAHVIILPDNDDPGKRHAELVAASLAGIARDVRVVELPGLSDKGDDVLDWLAAGHTIVELEELAFDTPAWNEKSPPVSVPAQQQPEDSVPPLSRKFPAPIGVLELLQMPEPDDVFVVEPFLPADANVLLAAYPKCFKTGFLLNLSIAAAAGTRFLGKFAVPRKHRVGLVLMEDRAHRVRRRLHRLCKGVDLQLDDLDGQLWHWFRPPLVLADPRAIDELAGHVKDHALDLLIVDSWSYVSSGNPNDAEIVTPQLMALSGLRDLTPGLSVILVHHARKTTQGGNQSHDERLTDMIRNSSAFGAWYDAGIALTRSNETAPIKVRMELRDLPAPESFTFTVQDEFPAGPVHGIRPEGWLRMITSNERPEVAIQRAAAARLAPEILKCLRANPGISKNRMRARLGVRGADLEAAFEYLLGEGKVRYEPAGRNGQAGKCYANDEKRPLPDKWEQVHWQDEND